jgi:peroxiredoxin family protein
MIHDAGGKIYACKATVDMFKLTKQDFCPQVDKILTVREFYEAFGWGTDHFHIN